MAITEGDDPTTSLAGLRGVANVVELCDDGTFDVPYVLFFIISYDCILNYYNDIIK